MSDDFRQVCGFVERGVACSWRPALPSWVEPNVDAMSVGHDEKPDEWRFSMFLRVCGQWVTAGKSIEPVHYDPLNGETSDSPMHVAQFVVEELLGSMGSKLSDLKREGAFDAYLQP